MVMVIHINPFATADMYVAMCVNISTLYNDTLVAKGLNIQINSSNVLIMFFFSVDQSQQELTGQTDDFSSLN